jgi:hypothetical protein
MVRCKEHFSLLTIDVRLSGLGVKTSVYRFEEAGLGFLCDGCITSFTFLELYFLQDV